MIRRDIYKLIVVGGFVGTKTEVWAASEDGTPLSHVGNIYPEDKSRRQVFPYVQTLAKDLNEVADGTVFVFRMSL